MTWLDATAVEVVPSGPLSGAMAAPSSKSLTNRTLLVAALAEGSSRVFATLAGDDVAAMCDAIAALGARLEDSDAGLSIEGTGGRLRPVTDPIDARLSGTTMRFIVAAAALAPAAVTVTGAAPLLRRPIGPLVRALAQLGATVRDVGGHPPVTVGGGLRGGPVTVDVTASSQFLSAVLLAAPYATVDVVAAASGDTAEAYVAMTADVMRRWGAVVEDDGPRRWRVQAGAGYRARDHTVEYDASAAAHLYALAAATGGSVTVTNATVPTLQPDAAILDVLTAMGCSATEEEGAVSVTGPAALQPVDVDLGAMPDQVTTVAALAALAEGPSTISGVAVTRGHETDRLRALATELQRLGVDVVERHDGLTIHGGTATGPVTLSTYSDHRLAMAFAALGAAIPGVVVGDPGCVAKTYPGFWTDMERTGARLRPAG